MTVSEGQVVTEFSEAEAPAVAWSDVENVLAESEMFWLSTVRRDGRPHVAPLPAMWLDGRRVLDNRARVFAEFVAGLGDQLAPGLDAKAATDLLWAFSNEGLWQELTMERGWSPKDFERWLAGTLIHQLLGAQ